MIGQPWWYVVVFVLVVAIIAAVPLCVWLEERDARRHNEAWSKAPGATSSRSGRRTA